MKTEDHCDTIRNDFPMMNIACNGHPLVYLDSAATTQKPQAVINALMDFYQHNYGTVHRALYSLSAAATERYNDVRADVAAFLNAPSEDTIVFTRGTTTGINMVARSYGAAFLQQGDEILITEIEHHSNIIPWRQLCQEKGLVLHVLPVNDAGEIIMKEYERLLSKKTKIVACAHIANAIGTIHPIAEIIQKAHSVGAVVLIDAAQSVSHIPLDVQELDVDFLVFSGHKIYGPTGVGILYGKKELLEAMPPYHGGGDMVVSVGPDSIVYQPPPLKFEAGTPMIAQVIGLGAALKYVYSIGFDTIHRREQELMEMLLIELATIPGITLYGPPLDSRGAIVSFTVDGMHPMDIGMMLDTRGVAIRTGQHCSEPTMDRFGVTSMVRVSLGVYNTVDDITIFLSSLRDILYMLTYTKCKK